ncbi:MAG: hypothetical protein FJ209_09110 [Betaproteobacteria bacterium]|nr:hypothetical protein [Betaproteobacteria bacterium]
MRIDSMTYYTVSLVGIRDNQNAIARLSQQIATQSNYLAAKDNPLATQKILDLGDRIATRAQYANNQTKAEITLKYESVVLDEIESTLRRARGLLAGISHNADAVTRHTHAEQLRGAFQQLLDLANSRDPSGSYIFSGDRTTTKPFNNAGGGVPPAGAASTYNGSTNLREVEVESGRRVRVNDNLDTVMRAGAGAGTDLLQTLDEAIVRLPLSAPPGAVPDQATLNGYIQTIDTALDSLAGIQYRVAGVRTELADLMVTTNGLQTLEQNALSDLQRVDQAAAIMRLQTRQTSLEAAQQAYALTSGLSLFSFLG